MQWRVSLLVFHRARQKDPGRRGGGESRRKGSGEFEMNKGARTCPYNTGSRKTISFFYVLRLLLLLLNILIWTNPLMIIQLKHARQIYRISIYLSYVLSSVLSSMFYVFCMFYLLFYFLCSIFYFLCSIFYILSSVLSSVFYLLRFIFYVLYMFYVLSSMFYVLFSIFYLLSSLSSIFYGKIVMKKNVSGSCILKIVSHTQLLRKPEI